MWGHVWCNVLCEVVWCVMCVGVLCDLVFEVVCDLSRYVAYEKMCGVR